MTDTDKKSSSETCTAFIFLVLFAIVIANYSKEDAITDGLEYYWNYAFMSLVLTGSIVGVSLTACCCGIYAAITENKTCATIIETMTAPLILACAIANCVFMFILIHNNPKVAKFQFVVDDNWKQIMLQVLCIIQCICILIISAVGALVFLFSTGAVAASTCEKPPLEAPLSPVVSTPENIV